MSLIDLPGAPTVNIGPGYVNSPATITAAVAGTMDAANEAIIFVGHVLTSDEGSHTIDTTGSSSFQWRTGAVTFANAGTLVKVGLAAVLTTAGPPARAANATDVITFDVSKTLTGGSGITANAWQTHVPDAGSKTIAHGDFLAFAIQMTARGGTTDSITLAAATAATTLNRPVVTTFTSATYAAASAVPNVIISFSDGALGYFHASDVFSTISTRTWNNTGATKEYGQLFSLPFPLKIYGIYGWMTFSADCDVVLYSSPLGTPVAEKTVSVDSNTVAGASGRLFATMFSSPYSTTANQDIAAVFKPGASNVSAFYKTLANANHRLADAFGTSGYGINRASGAFANANSSLDHYYIGLIAGAFDAGGGSSGRAVQINNDSLVG